MEDVGLLRREGELLKKGKGSGQKSRKAGKASRKKGLVVSPGLLP